jgi:hypothetical protein
LVIDGNALLSFNRKGTAEHAIYLVAKVGAASVEMPRRASGGFVPTLAAQRCPRTPIRPNAGFQALNFLSAGT